MLSRSTVIVVLLLLLLVFAMLNWGAFTAPTAISLGFTEVKAPLGLILLVVIALLCALFLAFALYLQGTALVEWRRLNRELEAQREVAQKAEASRFAELKSQVDANQRALLERLDRMDHDFGGALERTESAMAAYIGELDDRIGKGGSVRPG